VAAYRSVVLWVRALLTVVACGQIEQTVGRPEISEHESSERALLGGSYDL
jgi:hypothetical protein